MRSPIFALALLALATLQAEASPRLKYGIYGAVSARRLNQYRDIQDTTPEKRWMTDLDQLTFEPEIEFSPKLELESEIEFEHGGTGTTAEYDKYEEFGEFEQEVDQGGEVKLESLELIYKAKNWFNLKGGLIAVPIGWSGRDLPTDTFTVENNRAESRIIPHAWHDVGLGVGGEVGPVTYQYALVSGVDSEFFRKYNWIAGSSKRRFEQSFSDSWAHALRLDLGSPRDHRAIGVAGYYGDATGARQKPGRLTEPSHVTILEAHALYAHEGWKARALYLRGFLQNAHLVALANASLSNLASPGSFASVGRQAEAASLEVGYDLAQALPATFESPFEVFGRWEAWDPQKQPAQFATRDARFRESAWLGGINATVFGHPNDGTAVLIKAQYAHVRPGDRNLPTDHQIALGFGFIFFPKEGDSEDAIL